MKNYEMMFIVKTTLEETAVKNTVKEFSDIITSMNGKITKKLVVSIMYLISKLITTLSTN